MPIKKSDLRTIVKAAISRKDWNKISADLITAGPNSEKWIKEFEGLLQWEKRDTHKTDHSTTCRFIVPNAPYILVVLVDNLDAGDWSSGDDTDAWLESTNKKDNYQYPIGYHVSPYPEKVTPKQAVDRIKKGVKTFLTDSKDKKTTRVPKDNITDSPSDSLTDKLYSDEVELGYGVYDITGLQKIAISGIDAESPATAKKITNFFAKYPKAVFAEGYEADSGWLLEKKPAKIAAGDGHEFMYGTKILDTKGAKELLFVLNH